MGNKQRETLAQPAATLLPIMATRSRPHSPYHDRARTGTESLPNLNSPRLTSISDAPDTLPRHLEYPSGWLSSRFGSDPLPPIRPAAVPASVQHPACTHCTMTRKFDDDRNETCDICHRKSAFGWLYVCTEDHDGFIPADNEYSSTLCRESCDSDTAGEISLSPWIKKAIEHGQYTTDQIEILKLQRAKVEEAVSIARNPTPTSSVTHISESSYIEDTDDEAWTETVEDTSQPDTESEPEDSMPGISGPQVDHIRPRAHPVCRLMCCHACRPACRDRSWASLNAVCNETHVKPPPPWDVSNRRVSNTNVVRQLGLDKAETNRPLPSDGSPRSNESLKQNNSHGRGATNTEHTNEKLLAVTPSAHGKFEKIRRSTEKKASRQGGRSQIQSTDPVAPGSARRGGIDLIRKNRPLRSTSDQQPTASGGEPTDIGHNAELQTGPTSSKSRRPSLDSESDSEVDVPGGVALTEEGITTEKADLVTDKELDV
ncbi:hypothetical protein DTO282F9_8324 [Paecilomyces variotii]|nr:hypothetical protein DTO282F9_8324 [Paecilomyces variotii]